MQAQSWHHANASPKNRPQDPEPACSTCLMSSSRYVVSRKACGAPSLTGALKAICGHSASRKRGHRKALRYAANEPRLLPGVFLRRRSCFALIGSIFLHVMGRGPKVSEARETSNEAKATNLIKDSTRAMQNAYQGCNLELIKSDVHSGLGDRGEAGLDLQSSQGRAQSRQGAQLRYGQVRNLHIA